jgi:hypothetical protein
VEARLWPDGISPELPVLALVDELEQLPDAITLVILKITRYGWRTVRTR